MAWYYILLIVLGGVAVVFVLWGIWENHALKRTHVAVASKKVPPMFEGYRIVQISDLHNARFGKGQKKLAALVGAAQPDIIVVTGDFIDKRRPGTGNALRFAELAVRIAPVCYVAGNHEAKSKEFPALQTALEKLGVRLLQNAAVTLERKGERIVLAGLSDARFFTSDKKAFAEVSAQALRAFMPQDGAFTVLLAHRPELFSVYRAAGADLALCGHAHGGQFRIPFLGGLIAPDQGLFPEYSEGLYCEEGKYMVVSRGLGNSSVPIRLNNRPEVVCVTLHRGV